MGITGKPNFMVPGLTKKLTPLASSYASRTLTAKNEFLLHQAAACAFIALTIPDRASRDVVQIRALQIGRPKDEMFLDYGAIINHLGDGAKELATDSEWNEKLLVMENSNLLTHYDEVLLPAEDIYLSVCIRRLIEDYQNHLIDRKQAVHVLLEQAKGHLQVYHQEMRLFVQEARKSHSKKWVNKMVVELYLTKKEASRPGLGPKDKAGKTGRALHERITPFGEERVVKGKFRKPLKTALVAGVVFTAFTGLVYAM